MSTRSMVRALLLAGVGVALATWSVGPGSRKNVILITVDTLRADRLSSYGYQEHRTPNFDRLAEEGVLFENAFCDVTWTTPSMASVMTGRYPTVHGLRSSFQRLTSETITLAETLRAEGLHTAAIIASFPLHSVFGLNQGFVTYDEKFSAPLVILREPSTPTKHFDNARQEMNEFIIGKALGDAYRPDDQVSDRAIRWLREERHEPFFLWVHYFGPHEKPQPGTSVFEERRIQLDRYDPDVVFADEQVGRVLTALEELGLAERTAVVLHADHGQSLLEHNYFGHGRYVYESGHRIPLIIRAPGLLPAGQRVRRLARNVDLFPTILDLAQVAATVPVDGENLVAVAKDHVDSDSEEAYVETYLSATSLFADVIDGSDIRMGFRRVGLRTPQWKFIVNDPIPLVDRAYPPPITDDQRLRYYSEELYDLDADPDETTNVLAANRDLGATLLKRVWAYQPKSPSGSEHMQLDEETRAKLESLGYLAD